MLGPATPYANVCKSCTNTVSGLDERNLKPGTRGSHLRIDRAVRPFWPKRSDPTLLAAPLKGVGELARGDISPSRSPETQTTNPRALGCYGLAPQPRPPILGTAAETSVSSGCSRPHSSEPQNRFHGPLQRQNLQGQKAPIFSLADTLLCLLETQLQGPCEAHPPVPTVSPAGVDLLYSLGLPQPLDALQQNPAAGSGLRLRLSHRTGKSSGAHDRKGQVVWRGND